MVLPIVYRSAQNRYTVHVTVLVGLGCQWVVNVSASVELLQVAWRRMSVNLLSVNLCRI
jgi:hypothetical protein